ncbi:NADH dehydrogenase FAD-containing subunit [Saccharopolyspora erythraea NRRL 2338]|uniref:FAD-dependent oxidoreductase n=1 Tax=Saccharopolyspora erythraea TaxID=1836 RepID=A0ABP3LYB7_SACER|nr:FAD-dependent oxidoreductase [Saccharopolyspora erythraea]PFG94527.1 NADH dehydrogenase FAD-containing subunit [Saccharopolyspora erythraea NRRL 2338]
MTHRIVVLGAGYAGLLAARRIAEGVDARVTLVNAADEFVERVRLHQAAAGQRLHRWPLEDIVRDAGIELVLGRVTGIDADRREVVVDGDRALGYDKLVYALGSHADVESVPGVARHALAVATATDAAELRVRAAELAARGGVLGVVGGGSTGIEAATELAETYPDLRVRLLAGPEPLGWLSPKGRAHVHRVFDRLGIESTPGGLVSEVRDDRIVFADGSEVEVDATLWSAGFRVPGFAAEAGLECDGTGRIRVDASMRSVSHPDVYAVGDAARARAHGGPELRMSCAAGLPMAGRAARSIIAELTGDTPKPLRFRYYNLCLSLGRRDGLIQFVHGDDTPRNAVLTGPTAARYKETIVRGAAWVVRRSPYVGRRGKPVLGSALGV